MARKVSFSALESRSARLRLKIRRRPYSGPSLARGIMLLYRRNKTNGTWVLKASDGHGAYWTKGFALADDFENSDGKSILTFYEAQDQAKKLARGTDDAAGTAPLTVDGALKDYRRDNVYARYPQERQGASLRIRMGDRTEKRPNGTQPRRFVSGFRSDPDAVHRRRIDNHRSR
jgi:hypothetical protein